MKNTKRNKWRNNAFIALAASLAVTPVIVEHFTSNAESLQETTSALENQQVAPIVTAQKTTFKDIPTTYMYYDEITEMHQRGIIKGYADGTFNPNQTLNRQHAATFVYRVLEHKNIQLEEWQSMGIDDVSQKSEHYKALQLLTNAQLLSLENRHVYPYKELTRGEMAKILTTVFNLPTDAEHPLTDVSNAMSPYVAALYKAGITTGDNGKFNENQSLTRQHYAVFLYRALNYVEQAQKELVVDKVIGDNKDLQQKLTAIRKEYADVFTEKDAPIDTEWITNNPIGLVIYEKGLDSLRRLDMQLWTYYNYGTSLTITFDGYKNPTERLSNAAALFTGIGENQAQFHFDFREPKAEAITLDWLALTFPELVDDLTPLIKEKVVDGLENIESTSHTNREIIHLKGYEIQIGVSASKEMFILDIQ